MVIVRYNQDGSPDPTFGGDGLVIKNFGMDEFTTAGALQADDRIIIAGTFGPDPSMRDKYNFLVARFQSADVTTTASSSDNLTGEAFGGDSHQVSSAPPSNNDELSGSNPEAQKRVFRKQMQWLLSEETPVVGVRR